MAALSAKQNDLDDLRQRTQGKMALMGGVSSGLIVEGPPEVIAAEVRERMWQLGRNGGYFCGPDQGMPWPEEHIRALHQAVDEYGRYPLSQPGDQSEVPDGRHQDP